jgi:hypothetical protein
MAASRIVLMGCCWPSCWPPCFRMPVETAGLWAALVQTADVERLRLAQLCAGGLCAAHAYVAQWFLTDSTVR